MPWSSAENIISCAELFKPCTQEKADSRSPEVPILEGADDLMCFRLCLKPEDDTDVGLGSVGWGLASLSNASALLSLIRTIKQVALLFSSLAVCDACE